MTVLPMIVNQLYADVTSLTEFDWDAQRRPFVTYIMRITEQLHEMIAPLPADEALIVRIVPALGERLTQPTVSLLGYARLLLDQPIAFGGEQVSAQAAMLLKAIHAQASELMMQIDQIKQRSFGERLIARQANTQTLHLQTIFDQTIPIIRYWLHHKAVQLMVSPLADDLPMIVANAYHLSETLRHIVVTMAHELIEYGNIHLQAEVSEGQIICRILCSGIQLSPDERFILFEKEGRQIIVDTMVKMGAQFDYERASGYGASVLIKLPIARINVLQ